jgi:hypothetical protein
MEQNDVEHMVWVAGLADTSNNGFTLTVKRTVSLVQVSPKAATA